MEFEGYQFTISGDSCYPDREDIIKYIRNFTDDFNLRPYIKASIHIPLEYRIYHLKKQNVR